MFQANVGSSFSLPTLTLWHRECVRFFRQRSRVIGALGTPIVFWLLIGSGMRDSFRLAGASDINYLEYSFPGMMILIVLFTAIFSTISVIEDRKEGFLQSVLAAPVDRLAIVLGKVLGGTTLALAQALLFLMLAPLAGVPLSIATFIGAAGVLFVVAIGLSALGFIIAWRLDSTQGFHAIMNLFLIPMWLLSGAFFPASGASRWLTWIMTVNPLSYGVAALQRTLYSSHSSVGGNVVSLWVSLPATILFAVVMVCAAVFAVNRKAN